MVSARATLRADVALCERGLFESRAKAREAILAGLVAGRTAEGSRSPRSSSRPTPRSRRRRPIPYVSRGGVKLAHALAAFAIDAQDRYCLDVGASTGGFTDALLAAGARHVVAIDVGHGQLHERLRADPRVTSLEGLDARALTRGASRRAAVADRRSTRASSRWRWCCPLCSRSRRRRRSWLALVKPQFEAGRAAVKKGVVRDAGRPRASLRARRGRGRDARLARRSPSFRRRSRAATAIANFFFHARRSLIDAPTSRHRTARP